MFEEFKMHHDKQVWAIIENTHNGNTGTLVSALVLLVAVEALTSTMFYFKYLYITLFICCILLYYILVLLDLYVQGS